jgi:hypothetical protein
MRHIYKADIPSTSTRAQLTKEIVGGTTFLKKKKKKKIAYNRGPRSIEV